MEKIRYRTALNSAKKIMGENFIELKEAASVFSCKASQLREYETIPFSPELLYQCSEPENPFVLVPGFRRYGLHNRLLTIVEIKKHFAKKYPRLFAPCNEVDQPSPSFANKNTCWQHWYLLSKKVMDEEKIRKFFQKLEIGQSINDPEPWEREMAIVYVNAWMLFRELRKEEIFSGRFFGCSDNYSPLFAVKVCMSFVDGQIIFDEEPPDLVKGIIPSIIMNTQ